MSGFRSNGGSMRKAAATSRRGGKQARNRTSGERGRPSRKRPGGECWRLLSGDRRCISDCICHFPNSVTDSSAKEYHRLSEIMMWSSRDSSVRNALNVLTGHLKGTGARWRRIHPPMAYSTGMEVSCTAQGVARESASDTPPVSTLATFTSPTEQPATG